MLGRGERMVDRRFHYNDPSARHLAIGNQTQPGLLQAKIVNLGADFKPYREPRFDSMVVPFGGSDPR